MSDLTTNSKKAKGLFAKFEVRRTDGSDEVGGKHHGCDYFVLDLTHDPHAHAAILAYADSCESDGYVVLARDLRYKAKQLRERDTKEEAV